MSKADLPRKSETEGEPSLRPSGPAKMSAFGYRVVALLLSHLGVDLFPEVANLYGKEGLCNLSVSSSLS